MKKFGLYTGIGLLLWSCGGGSLDNNISGKLTNAKGKVITLEVVENNMPRPVDSATIAEDGSFTLDLPYGRRTFYRVKIDADNMIVLCTDSTEQVKVEGDATKFFDSYKVSGSKHSQDIADFFHEIDALNKQLMELETQMRGFNAADTAAGMALGMKHNEVTKKRDDFVRSFIDKHPQSAATYMAVGYLNMMNDFEYYKKTEKALNTCMQGSEYHNFLVQQISQYEYQKQQFEAMQKEMNSKLDALRANLPTGKTPPDIKYTNPEGKVIALSSMKGKYVLVDFWASWCRPCRAENPNVVRLYRKYKDKGFTVYSVSLDQDKKAWESAIEQDGLEWPNHVSELKQWQSSVVNDYGFGTMGIPFALLLDKEGKVIDIGLRGEALEKKLEEIFGS